MAARRRAKSRRRAKRTPRRRPPGLLPLVYGYWIAQLVYVAAQLDLADVLAKGPLTAEGLAKRVGADPGALYRVLRALASVGVFRADAMGRYHMTPLAQTLRSGHPHSLRDFAR